MSRKTIHYIFEFDGDRVEFDLHFEAATMRLLETSIDNPPEWVKLTTNQCPNCPLREADTQYCPVAYNLQAIIDICSKLCSFDDIRMTVNDGTRSISADTSAQRAVASVLGLVIATSGCPRTDFLRPMARFHLPLADEVETIYRVASCYFLGQFFRWSVGKELDMSMSSLKNNYRNLEMVNAYLAKRFRAAGDTDATVNAVVILDLLAKGISYIDEDQLSDYKELYSDYFK